jgi:putative GTP pyrophosphokinase
MDSDLKEHVLDEYERQQPIYHDFVNKLEQLLREVLDVERLSVHSVTGRAKTLTSLRRKLARPAADYGILSDVTDIAGIRIICYFESDVDEVARIVQSEFSLDLENTVDKRALLDPDRFGYLSLHHVVALGDDRRKLSEYRRFANLKAEIQIRSVLQHAWAEIEHDLGYKSAVVVPAHVRRRFSRVAGLLELADQEFVEIRRYLQSYADALPETIAGAPDRVGVDLASVTTLVQQDADIAQIDAEIAASHNAGLAEGPVSTAAERLVLAGFKTIAEIQVALRKNRSDIVRYADALMPPSTSIDATITRGVSLFYLAYVHVLKMGDESRFESFLESAGIASATNMLFELWTQMDA